MALTGALVRKVADQTTADYDPQLAVAWDSEVYDTTAFHDNSTANTRITIPAAVNGQYGIIRANLTVTSIDATANVYASIYKNGSAPGWMGWGGKIRLMGGGGVGADGAAKLFLQASTQPHLLSTGDYYEVFFFCGDTSVTIEAESSSFGIQIVGAQIAQGCLAKKAADQTTADYNPSAVIAWDGTDVYDTDAGHDPSSSNSKIIVPSAWNGRYGVLTAVVNASLLTASGTVSMAIQKGGSDSYDGFGGNSKNIGGLTGVYIHCETQPILLTTAEEFEARLYSTDASITIEAEMSTFGCWIVG